MKKIDSIKKVLFIPLFFALLNLNTYAQAACMGPFCWDDQGAYINGVKFTGSFGTGSPAGNTTEVQFNNAGSFGATSNFTWDSGTNLLSVSNLATDEITAGGDLIVNTTALTISNAYFRGLLDTYLELFNNSTDTSISLKPDGPSLEIASTNLAVDPFILLENPANSAVIQIDTSPSAYQLLLYSDVGIELTPDSGGVFIGRQSNIADTSAILEASSTVKGFLPPRMNTTSRNAISPAEGLIIYNTTTHTVQVSTAANNSSWMSLN